MNNSIEGDVINIIDQNTILINKGKTHGVEVEYYANIYIEGPMIKDLDGSNLEPLVIEKARMKIIQVQDKICTAQSIKVYESGILDPMISLRGIIGRSYYPKIALSEDIDTDIQDFLEANPEKRVKIGDKVLIWKEERPSDFSSK